MRMTKAACAAIVTSFVLGMISFLCFLQGLKNFQNV